MKITLVILALLGSALCGEDDVSDKQPAEDSVSEEGNRDAEVEGKLVKGKDTMEGAYSENFVKGGYGGNFGKDVRGYGGNFGKDVGGYGGNFGKDVGFGGNFGKDVGFGGNFGKDVGGYGGIFGKDMRGYFGNFVKNGLDAAGVDVVYDEIAPPPVYNAAGYGRPLHGNAHALGFGPPHAHGHTHGFGPPTYAHLNGPGYGAPPHAHGSVYGYGPPPHAHAQGYALPPHAHPSGYGPPPYSHAHAQEYGPPFYAHGHGYGRPPIAPHGHVHSPPVSYNDPEAWKPIIKKPVPVIKKVVAKPVLLTPPASKLVGLPFHETHGAPFVVDKFPGPPYAPVHKHPGPPFTPIANYGHVPAYKHVKPLPPLHKPVGHTPVYKAPSVISPVVKEVGLDHGHGFGHGEVVQHDYHAHETHGDVHGHLKDEDYGLGPEPVHHDPLAYGPPPVKHFAPLHKPTPFIVQPSLSYGYSYKLVPTFAYSASILKDHAFGPAHFGGYAPDHGYGALGYH